MPARIDELLSQRLAGLPPVDGGPAGWQAVQDKLRRRERRQASVQQCARWSVAASIAVLATVVAVGLAPRGRVTAPSAAAVAGQRPAAASSVDSTARLRAQSLALERVLDAMPERPTVARADTSLPIDTLEVQVQWLDHQLSAADEPASPAREEQLWRERVEVMNSLVRLRYAEAQRLAM